MNWNFNRTRKSVFQGAAATVTTRTSQNRFREDYESLCAEGARPDLAKLTIARKIAATTLAMWKSEEVYDPDR